MAYRGRGRGRGGFSGGGGFGFAKQEPFVLFPDIDLPIPKGISDLQQKTDAVIEEENLINQTRKFQKIWKDSPYYLEQSSLNGSRVQQPGRKRVRWNPNSGLEKLDLFEKLEQRQGQNDTKEKKEGEGEDEDENEEEEEQEEEDFSDDDYYKGFDVDDDEDDYNMEDDGDGLASEDLAQTTAPLAVNLVIFLCRTTLDGAGIGEALLRRLRPLRILPLHVYGLISKNIDRI
ncbi:hypothetical protein C1H46_023070 [Malus baccata]|uniref:DNA-directed RNA polymerase III subunit n=1 Tax=Malus baccata TaxID=106549 RepID=A0A540LYC0_MALBA|nr:hypothetical protein C1H46_023070 [Malus baccata]